LSGEHLFHFVKRAVTESLNVSHGACPFWLAATCD
jgi:hypothetical protein